MLTMSFRTSNLSCTKSNAVYFWGSCGWSPVTSSQPTEHCGKFPRMPPDTGGLVLRPYLRSISGRRAHYEKVKSLRRTSCSQPVYVPRFQSCIHLNRIMKVLLITHYALTAAVITPQSGSTSALFIFSNQFIKPL